MSTLLDIWDEPETTGIFTVLNNYDVPWKSSNIYESLNLTYYYNHSGQKNVSPLVSGILGIDSSLTDAEKTKIGLLVYNVCGKNWDYIYNAMFADYDPIENYNADETETTTGSGNTTHGGSDTIARTGTDTHTLSGSDTTSDTGTDKFAESGDDITKNTGTDKLAQTGDDVTKNTGTTTNENANVDGTSETINGIAGFNSTEYSSDNKSTTTVNQTITDTRTDDLTQTLTHGLTTDETRDLTETLTHGKNTEETRNLSESTTYGRTDTENVDISETTNYNNTENRSDSETRTLKRHGNIGVTTSQQMIESELELRRKNFFEIVFKDVDNYLTLAIY